MEKLVKQRKPIRASYTKTYNEVMRHLTSEIVDLESAQKMLMKLERLSAELAPLDEKILELALEEEDDVYSREYGAVETYRDNLDEVRLKMTNICSNENVGVVREHISEASSAAKRNLKLPRLELAKFGGDVKDWLGFWSMFKRIHEDSDIESEDKFQYLIQCTKPDSRARELLNSFPATAENYPKVIECMKNRFGREDLLTEYYVRELIGLVIQNVSHNNDKSGIAVGLLYDTLESKLRALESIGVTRDKYGSMLFPLVESCLPEDVLRTWLRNQSVNDELIGEQKDRLEALLNFLKREVEGEERITFARAGFGLSDTKRQERVRGKNVDTHLPTANSLFSAKFEGKKRKCVFCSKFHESKECHLAQQMSLEERRNKLAKENCCFACLKVGHRMKNCKAHLRCPLCTSPHVVIMCHKLNTKKVEEKPESKIQDDRERQSNISMNIQSATKEVFLQTLCIKLTHKGKEKMVRALIDSGSQRSYILRKTAEEMGYKPLKTEMMIHKLFGGAETREEDHHLYDVNVSSCDGSFNTTLQLIDQKVICGKIPRLKFGPWMKEMKAKKIWLSDVGTNPSDVEVLLGADVARSLLLNETHKLESGLVAVRTTLGWTVTGKLKDEEGSSLALYSTTLFIQSASITDLWNLETIGISDPMENKSREEMEEAARHYFQETVKVNADSRYEVALPWLESRQYLRNNKEIAEKRLISVSNRLTKEGKFEEYGNVFQEWMNEGIIEEVPEGEKEDLCYYLPHRGIFKENSTTTVRPVFDGSSKSKDTPSLNECLEKGPNLLQQIPTLLLMFRKNRIGVISDIKKAFLQISVQESDRDFLRFLWWKDSKDSELKVFRHCRVVFGLNCSPFLLEAVLDLQLKESVDYQETAKRLRNSFYVDNCITSLDNEEELSTFIEESTALLARARFDLRNWEYTSLNSPESDSSVPEVTSVLGLRWNKTEDVLSCEKIDMSKIGDKITRRNVLAAAQRIFDPIGFTCPVSLVPKLLLQESWRKKMSWDEEMEDDMRKKFEIWHQELEVLPDIKIPRQMARCKTQESWSLHTFCDASGVAYAAVVFLRSEDGKDTNITLLQAKSRVAPLKKMTISRLELLACSIGARLAFSIKASLELAELSTYYWTDSTTALCWIKRKEVWGTFVANRVKEIKQLSNPDSWNHVRGVNNPADLPSRGCSASKLLTSKWWEGPHWLRSPSSEWPLDNALPDEERINEEKRKGISTVLVSVEPEGKWYLKYFSKYSKVVRMTAWILRFIHNTAKEGKKRISKELQVEELQVAERRLLKIVTQEMLAEKEQSFKNLNVFEDERGLLRVKTRLIRRPDDELFLTPILLPAKHQLVHMMIMEKHLEMSHAGVQVLLSTLRERFWIVNGRRTIRKVISSCVRCRRHQAKGITIEVAPLPEDRIRDASVFEIVGIDLAGPLYLRGGEKVWVVLFTCAVFRAVHFELVRTLSTPGFLQALRRFVARRGRPNIIYSDNGTNFVGAENAFSEVDWTKINVEATCMRIVWKFNPPTAAWWGGFWERIVQMLKKLLRRVLGRSSLDYEELLTVLLDAEAVINSRPLTYLSEDSDDLVALTPAMFLQDIPRVGVPDIDHIDQLNHGKRFRHMQHLRAELRKRFRLEYLGQLKPGKGKANSHRELKVGEVVILGSDSARRMDWPLGRVVSVHPGKDNVVRVVKVKTTTGELKRPVQNIYPLEATPFTEWQCEEVLDKDPGVPVSSSGVPVSIPGVPVSSSGVPVSSPGAPVSSPDVPVSPPGVPHLSSTRCGRKIRIPSRLNL